MEKVTHSKRRRVNTKRFDMDDYENEDMLLLNQALLNSRKETRRVHVTIPEAPIYYPTLDEFKDPLKYIRSIKGTAEKYGICKIVPPKEWNPPMSIDMTDPRLVPTKKQHVNTLQEGNNIFPDGQSYNIADYKTMADRFRKEWISAHHAATEDVTMEDLEKNYWDIVETASHEVAVEYGNDLDTSRYASGFPKVGKSIIKESRENCTNEDINNPNYYATTDWNLANIPNSKGSVLKRVETPINGINVPWLYLGMLFTTFCWHNEDNYLYSINYSHFGDVKQWYGVPGENASQFEKVSKEFYRESFIESPDLLHHMTTQVSVSRIVANRVPVYQVKQDARTFVITFPKAFHCGFSYGFNCGEAVNFAPPDWLSFGDDAERRYRTCLIPRTSVFSHVRLLFTLKNYAADMDLTYRQTLWNQIDKVLEEEIGARHVIKSQGIPEISEPAYKNNFSTIDQAAADYDDQRMCLLCKQVCVFSAIACECSSSDVSCIRHYSMLCRCGKMGPGEHVRDLKKHQKQASRPTKFLISWASIKDLEVLRLESKKLLLGEMASPPPVVQASGVVKVETPADYQQIKQEAGIVVADIACADTSSNGSSISMGAQEAVALN